jgi:hypothetical protein
MVIDLLLHIGRLLVWGGVASLVLGVGVVVLAMVLDLWE